MRWPALLAATVALGARSAAAPSVPPFRLSALPSLVSTDSLAAWQLDKKVILLDVRPDLFVQQRGHARTYLPEVRERLLLIAGE